MNSLERDIGKILATLEAMNEKLERHFEEDREVAKRVYRIEGKLNWYAGALAVIGAFFTLTSDVILKIIGMKS